MTKTHGMTLTGLVGAALTLAGGCHQAPPPPKPKATVVWQAPLSRTAQARELVDRADDLDQDAAKLPGTSTDEHRQIAADMLNDLSKAIQLAAGSPQSPQLANRIGVINASQATLSHVDIARPQLEAAENEAVRAAIAALDQIAADSLSDDAQLKTLLDAARATLDPMYTVGGPMHDLVASDGLKAVVAVVRRVSDDFVERFGKTDASDRQAGPSSAPATAPAGSSM